MFIGTMGALLAGASPIPHAIERKDDGGLTAEVKAAVDALGRTFEEFKSTNDARLKEFAKKGTSDVVTQETVDRINSGIDEAKSALQKRLDELEAKANRLALGGSPDAAAEQKAAETFGELVGKGDFTAAELKEYRADLGGYLRRNEVKSQTMMVANDPSGGYWITPDVTGRMVKKVYASTPMRQLASVVQIGTDRLEGPIDNGEGDAAWVGEQEERKQTGLSGLGMWGIDVNELYAYPQVSLKLLEDAKIDIEAWISDKSVAKFARKENAAFLRGDGVRKPKGLLTYDTAATADDERKWGVLQFIKTGKADGFKAADAADCFIDLIYELAPEYRQAASFLAARRSLGAVRKLKDGQGNYLVDLRLRDGALVESIFGFPTVDGEDMPKIEAAATPFAFGDFAEAYTIVERTGVSVTIDNITRPGFRKYLMRKRVGGGLVNSEAVKLLKIAA